MRVISSAIGRMLSSLGLGAERAARSRGAVRLLAVPRAAPRTSEERLVLATLESAGPLAFEALVSRAARALCREEWRRGRWVTDIGVLAPDLWALDVERVLEAGNGRLWAIGDQDCREGVVPATVRGSAVAPAPQGSRR